MDHLWSPWRYRYVTSEDNSERPKPDCIFCDKAASTADDSNLVVFRGALSYGLLNLYPYTNGHMMVAPYVHAARIEDLPEDTWIEIMRYARIAERNLRQAYRCDGLNLGFNIGSVAGAGIAGHLHMHLVPRWQGDANFMTIIGETRVHPEDLPATLAKLRSLSWELS
jgi:ATP adenylyltransferase